MIREKINNLNKFRFCCYFILSFIAIHVLVVVALPNGVLYSLKLLLLCLLLISSLGFLKGRGLNITTLLSFMLLRLYVLFCIKPFFIMIMTNPDI